MLFVYVQILKMLSLLYKEEAFSYLYWTNNSKYKFNKFALGTGWCPVVSDYFMGNG